MNMHGQDDLNSLIDLFVSGESFVFESRIAMMDLTQKDSRNPVLNSLMTSKAQLMIF